MPQGYLVEMPQREHEACRRLVQMPFLSEGLFRSVGLDASFCWLILRAKKERLVHPASGDVDILAGRLAWTDPGAFDALVSEERANAQAGRHDSWNYFIAARRLALGGAIKWPPTTEYLVGVEAKCAYLNPTAQCISAEPLKSTKSSGQKVRKIRRQVEGLLKMGLNHAVLLDIIANPPVSGPDGGTWITSLGAAVTSIEKMSPILLQRLPQESEAAHWAWSIGSVVGGDESRRGAGAPVQLRRSRGNARLTGSAEMRAVRRQVEKRLATIFSNFPRPTTSPAIYLDCEDCGNIHAMPWDGTACRSA